MTCCGSIGPSECEPITIRSAAASDHIVPTHIAAGGTKARTNGNCRRTYRTMLAVASAPKVGISDVSWEFAPAETIGFATAVKGVLLEDRGATRRAAKDPTVCLETVGRASAPGFESETRRLDTASRRVGNLRIPS